LRGGGAADGPATVVARQGYLNGLGYDPNSAALAAGVPAPDSLRAAADMVRLGLAGSLRGYRFTTRGGVQQSGAEIAYGDQPAGYASEPGEVVNYVENHDNTTLWDLNAYKLPLATPAAERARVQVLGLALVAFSQGVAYVHAGTELLRSKSMDGNSYDSGDWFNRIDWTAATNHFGSGLPPARDNAAFYSSIAPRLTDARLKPAPADIVFARDAFFDLLRIRASSRLFHLRSADAVQRRLLQHNTGPAQNPVLIAAELDGAGLDGAGFRRILLLVNVDKVAQPLTIASTAGQPWVLHPVHRAPAAADRRAAIGAGFDIGTGSFQVPARTAVVYVLE
jgi:pullulanase/glycogen debranching enzyme